jgi:hypothetical protein
MSRFTTIFTIMAYLLLIFSSPSLEGCAQSQQLGKGNSNASTSDHSFDDKPGRWHFPGEWDFATTFLILGGIMIITAVILTVAISGKDKDQLKQDSLGLDSTSAKPIITFQVPVSCDSIVPIFDGQASVKYSKKRESLFFSTHIVSFEGISGVDKKVDGSFDRTSLKVEQNDTFYLMTKSAILTKVDVINLDDDKIILAFKFH